MFRYFFPILALLIAACSRNAPSPPDVLRLRISADPTTLDPRKASDYVSATIVSLLYEGLTRSLPDGTVEMGLAERVDISKDGKRYVFYLRKAYWSDGIPITAMDFEASWKQILCPSHPSVSSYLFYSILNAEAAVRKEKTVEEVGIRALDESTLEVLLEQPTPYFLSLISFPSFLPTPQHQLDQLDCPGPGWVSNGPFILHKMESQSLIVLQKNPTFWHPEQIRLAGIFIYIIPNDMTALEMFERKELDWLGGYLSAIPPDALPSLQERLHYFPIAASTFCTFNTERVPFCNQHIRKAFNFATDRVEIAREIFPTNQIFASRYIPPALCNGKNRILFPPFNPSLAREHLAKGLQELKDPITSVTIHYRLGTTDERLAQILKEMWETTLGIKVKLRQTDGKTHKDCLHKRNYEIALSSWIAQYPDPMNILERFKNRSNAKNYCSWEDPEFIFLLEQAKKTIDPLERLNLLEKAEELLADQVPIIPLYHWSNPSLAHSRLRNHQTTPGGGILFERCWLANEP